MSLSGAKDMQLQEQSELQGPIPPGPGLEAQALAHTLPQVVTSRAERLARSSFIWPALLVVLLLSIFPLLISLYLSLSYLQFVPGGFDIRFIGLDNYRGLLFGNERTHFLGLMR